MDRGLGTFTTPLTYILENIVYKDYGWDYCAAQVSVSVTEPVAEQTQDSLPLLNLHGAVTAQVIAGCIVQAILQTLPKTDNDST